MAYGLLMKYKFHLKLTSDQLSGNTPVDLNQKKLCNVPANRGLKSNMVGAC